MGLLIGGAVAASVLGVQHLYAVAHESESCRIEGTYRAEVSEANYAYCLKRARR